jgi:hypothetical protein
MKTKDQESFNNQTKAKMYAPLRTEPLAFSQWLTASGLDRFTFNQYRHHALSLEEVGKEPSHRGKYHLTEKGEAELARIEDILRLETQRRYYHAPLTSLNELVEPAELWNLESQVHLLELPLPGPVDVGMYGSEELFPLFEWAEDHLQYHDGVGSKKVRGEFLKGSRHIVEPFIWTHIWERLILLLGWHGRYELKLTKDKPPPLTLENILGFDLSFLMNYEGKKLLKQAGPEEFLKIGKRLVGAILLKLAFAQEGGSEWSSGDVIPLLVKSRLLDQKDAEDLSRVVPKEVIKRENHGGFVSLTGSPGKFRWRDRTKTVLPIALRYLSEGGVLQVPKGSTPEAMARQLEIPTPLVILDDDDRKAMKSKHYHAKRKT